MNVLHLLSNWKWTERAEPATDLALAEKRLGANVGLVCGRKPEMMEASVEYHASRKGLNAVALEMPKHFRLGAALRDSRAIRRMIADTDVAHCHMPNDHFTAWLARRGAAGRSAIVRSCYEPEGLERGLRSWFLYGRQADGVVVISLEAKRDAVERMGLPAERVEVIEPGIDVERFSAPLAPEASRCRFGLAPEHLVIGIVTRIRRSRRVDVALGGFREVAGRFPEARFLIVGRGREDSVESEVRAPARRMGLEGKVILAGYCADEALVAAYRAMDVLVYPVPGTDGSCRTVREAMAAGVPVVASKTGFLPNLVQDGVTGRLVELSADSFAACLVELCGDRQRLRAIGCAAGETARRRFPLELQGRKTLAFYRRILEQGGKRTS